MAATAAFRLARHPGSKIEILDRLCCVGGACADGTILLHFFEFGFGLWVHCVIVSYVVVMHVFGGVAYCYP